MKTILFYSSVSDKSLFQTQKFYAIDINILKQIGYDVRLSNSIFDAFKFWKYDIVYGYFFRWSFLVSIISSLFRKRVYLTGGIDALDRSFAGEYAYNIQKVLFLLCYKFSTKCIIVSPTDLEHVKEILKGEDSKLAYSEHTVETKSFSISNFENKEKIFTTIGWQGHVSDRKGIDKAILLFKLLHEFPEFADYKFYIIGRKGLYTPVLQKIIEDNALTNSVIITGEISEEEKVNYLKKSQYYFQLSKYEGFGIAALEALIAGNVVLHSGKGGLSNPIYNIHIKVDIDVPLSGQVLDIRNKMLSLNRSQLLDHANKMSNYYDNSRRKQELEKIFEIISIKSNNYNS